jgi:hypothetical protein
VPPGDADALRAALRRPINRATARGSPPEPALPPARPTWADPRLFAQALERLA